MKHGNNKHETVCQNAAAAANTSHVRCDKCNNIVSMKGYVSNEAYDNSYKEYLNVLWTHALETLGVGFV